MPRPSALEALRPYGLILLFVGVLGLTMKSWIDQAFHLSSQNAIDAVDFFFGTILGVGLVLTIGTFSARLRIRRS